MIPDAVRDLCTSKVSVTSLINENSNWTPAEAYDKLIPQKTPPAISAFLQKHSAKSNDEVYGDVLDEDLEDARRCGNFEGTEPSKLFLKIFYHVLRTLGRDHRAGVVSPSLMGTTGVVPLTIMSIIPDIMRHYANLIVHAQKSIILATNFWAASNASHIITDAFRELSRRRLDAGLPPVNVKILYDRGNLKQALKNHIDVSEEEYSGDKVQIPRHEEVRGLTLQVVNYHVPAVGTFHAKWMVVDGRVAVLNSNNIQDVPNMEMACHYEGPIVDSFYDSALISWNNALKPQLDVHKFYHEDDERKGFEFADMQTISKTKGGGSNEDILDFRNGYLQIHTEYQSKDLGRNGKDLVPFAAQLTDSNLGFEAARLLVPEQPDCGAHQTSTPRDSGYSIHESESTHPSGKHPGPLHMGGSPDLSTDQNPGVVTPTTPPVPEIVSNTGHIGRTIATEDNQDEVARIFKDESDGMLADSKDVIKIEYDDTLSAEAERVRGFLGTTDKLTKHLNTDTEAHVEQFNPYILHPPHKLFPIAMVNRRPIGSPGHQSLRVPQNEAWIAALRLAEKQVFIQTPDLNASDLLPEIPKAVKRGIEVILYITLGYNDTGELLPFQNGTNEQTVCSLFNSLSSEEEKERLKVYWYTAKDMRTPIHAKPKRRTCHIKLLVADGHIGIQGSGNQDTQSWYHSQETNVMIDSKEVVSEWLWGIRSNQNTHIWGRVDNDGVWRSKEGRGIVTDDLKEGEGLPGTLGGGKIKFGWVKGIKGAIQRVQGVGGF
ncbi:hypothetical protein ABW19_dt0210126 [Dactylella cylindrospora]|nr:hypothetical protein ABW19_dt0210126 [Dactylella cylindrospora]